jgi:hypothetical protein
MAGLVHLDDKLSGAIIAVADRTRTRFVTPNGYARLSADMAKAYFAIDPGSQLEIDYPIRGLDDVKTLAHNYWLRDIDPSSWQDVSGVTSR